MSAAENDPRVQAIRCLSCHRLRPHPTNEETFACFCGGREFAPSYPYPDEMTWALTIYEREIKERELWRYT